MPREPPVMRAVRPARERGTPEVGMEDMILTLTKRLGRRKSVGWDRYDFGQGDGWHPNVQEVTVMAKVVLVVRVLLGLLFFVFGMIGILNLVKAPLPPGDAGVFVGVLMGHGYMKFISLLEVIAGLLLLVGRYVPLGLVILGPI